MGLKSSVFHERHLMRNKCIFLIASVVFFFTNSPAGTIYSNLVAPAPGSTDSLEIHTGQIARVLTAYGTGGCTLTVSIGTNSFVFTDSILGGYTTTKGTVGGPTVAGPARISLRGVGNGTAYSCIQITVPDVETLPSTAVVIPTDATGPVRILLESSADLVNWTSALPGSYGADTANRFFRVRAERQ